MILLNTTFTFIIFNYVFVLCLRYIKIKNAPYRDKLQSYVSNLLFVKY